MKKAIIGKKVGMTQIFDESGKVIPVTVVEAGPCVVTQKKTVETDGYAAVQLGFEDVKESKLSKPEAGHLKKAGVEAKKHLKEFKLEGAADMNVGDVVKADTFAAGDMIDVTGISKGHGYQRVTAREPVLRQKFQQLPQGLHALGFLSMGEHKGAYGEALGFQRVLDRIQIKR